MILHYYTITTNDFYQYTLLMLKSFLRYSNNDDKIFVLTVDEIENKINHPKIAYFSCKHILDQQIINNPDLVDKPPLYLCCWLMKSRCVDFPELMKADIITYIDSDILLYQNISNYILEISKNNGESLLYVTNDGSTIKNPANVNSGFYFTNINKYPFIDLMNTWHSTMMDILPNRESFRKTDRLVYKYFDQPILNDILQNNKLFNKYKILSPETISFKRFHTGCVLVHYIKRHKLKMQNDYDKLIAQ